LNIGVYSRSFADYFNDAHKKAGAVVTAPAFFRMVKRV